MTLDDTQRAANLYFRAAVRNLDAATEAVIKTSAQSLKRQVAAQIKSQFRTRSPSFAKAVKVYNLKPSGALGPASYVRLGVPWMGAFQEGSALRGKQNLILLLSDGEALGYKRIGPGNPWESVWAKLQSKSAKLFPAKDGNGYVVAVPAGGTLKAVYKLQHSVKVPKLLSFYEAALTIGNEIPTQIDHLLDS
jgi:Family of unknown function (DUF6441)